MTTYPFLIDNGITLPGVSGASEEDIAITALRSAVFAIETELGIKPSGIYPDVRTRLDILESRINFSVSPSIPNDGYVKSPLFIFNPATPLTLTISVGDGYPTENRLQGSLYMRGDGYDNDEFYIRGRDGYWHPIQTTQWKAGGDLSGNYLSQKVIGIRNKSLSVSLETIGSVQDGYHLTWSNPDGYWRAETGFLATNDLSPAVGSGPTHGTNTGRTAQTVVGFQNRKISTDVPQDGYVLTWEAADNHWDAFPLATVFKNSVTTTDGYVLRTNISSNRRFQSPTSTGIGLIGVTNFGNATQTLAGAGTTANYSGILGGDNNFAAGNFGVVVGGSLNHAGLSSIDGYTFIGDGYNNSTSGLYATVLNGTLNVASSIEAIVLDGYSNTASSGNSFIINGGNNQANASFSGVLNGISNTIAAGNTHAGIGWGSLNTITGSSATYAVILGGSGNTTNSQNAFIGSPTNGNVQSSYGAIVAGFNNSIGVSSTYGAIVDGYGNIINNSSSFGFIGSGNNISVTGLYSTVLNSTIATANGLHTTIINGNTNSVTATFSTIGNGNNNTISSNPAYATILDGYQNTITGSGGFIADGYSNNLSGIWSTILNGNNNILASRNSTILNGSSNTTDLGSAEITIFTGTGNSVTTTTNAFLSGNGNTLLNSSNSYVLGTFNNIQSTSTKVIGSLNTVAAGGTLNRILGNSNILGASSNMNNVFGQSNSLGPSNSTHDNTVIGTSNIVDGYGNSNVFGSNNMATANFSTIVGQFGKARMYGQQVHASSRFNAGRIGEAQWSRVVLTGGAASGASFLLQLQDLVPVNMTFQDGYAYELSIRVLVSSTTAIPTPVATARFVIDVLMHQDNGTLVIDNVNRALESQNGTTWTVSCSGYQSPGSSPVLPVPSNNQFQLQVDTEVAPFIQGSSATRRAIASVEIIETYRGT